MNVLNAPILMVNPELPGGRALYRYFILIVVSICTTAIYYALQTPMAILTLTNFNAKFHQNRFSSFWVLCGSDSTMNVWRASGGSKLCFLELNITSICWICLIIVGNIKYITNILENNCNIFVLYIYFSQLFGNFDFYLFCLRVIAYTLNFLNDPSKKNLTIR